MSFTISRTNLSLITAFLIVYLVGTTFARTPHSIEFRAPNLFPESFAWDPSSKHFIVGSLRHRTILSISDTAVVDTLISDPSLPPNSTILGVSIDTLHNRLLAAIHSTPPLPIFNALAAYDLNSRRRLFLAPLHDPTSTSTSDRPVANDVAVDFSGNAYITNSASNFIWKVNLEGEPSVFSKSPVFTSHPVDHTAPYSFCSINGVVYINNGYLLVVQTNTGKMFKVNTDNGTAKTVRLNKDLPLADGVAVRRDGVVVVVSQHKLYFVKSDSSWSDGVVYEETALDVEGFATSVTIGDGDRVYVLYGHVKEGLWENKEREKYRILEIDSKRESGERSVWVFVLIGLGLAYFLFQRFKMRQLGTTMAKKTA